MLRLLKYLWHRTNNLHGKLLVLAVAGSNNLAECALSQQVHQVVSVGDAAALLHDVVTIFVVNLLVLVALQIVSDRSLYVCGLGTE
jgi:hypothetical protein